MPSASQLTPLPPTDRFAVVFPQRGKSLEVDTVRLRPPWGRTDREAVRWGQVGVISRGTPLSEWGGCEAPGPRPDDLQLCVPFRRSAGASRGTVIRKPSGRGFLTRSDGGPRRAGRWLRPGPHGRFQPMPAALADLPPPGFRPDVSGNLPRTVAKGCHRRPPTNASRSTTPESRIGRRTCALPMPSGEIRIRAVRKGEDQIGSKKFRALKSRDFIR